MAGFSGPDGVVYTLDHLASSEVVIAVKVGDEELQVPLWVVYRNHCYSRDYAYGKDGDEELEWRLPDEPGERSIRLFCRDRWAYSHSLPAVVKAVLFASKCFRTTNRGLYYKFDRASKVQAGSYEGIYLFFKFARNRYNHAGLMLSVESVHERTTLPMNDRGRQQTTFKIALIEFLKDNPDILEEIRKAKGP